MKIRSIVYIFLLFCGGSFSLWGAARRALSERDAKVEAGWRSFVKTMPAEVLNIIGDYASEYQLLQKHIQRDTRISGMAFKPKSLSIACSGNNKIITLTEFQPGDFSVTFDPIAPPMNGGSVVMGHVAYQHSLAFSPNGLVLADSTSDRLRFLHNGIVSYTEGVDVRYGCLSFDFIDTEGRYLAVIPFEAGVKIWDRVAHQWVATVPAAESGYISELISIPQRARLVTLSSDDGALSVWNVSSLDSITREFEEPFTQHADAHLLAASSDGSRVVKFNRRLQQIEVWDMSALDKTPVPERNLSREISESVKRFGVEVVDSPGVTWRPLTVEALAISPDGKTLAAAWHMHGWDDEGNWRRDTRELLRLWDIETGKVLLKVPPRPEDSGEVLQIKFNDDGRLLAVAIGNKIYFWTNNRIGHYFSACKEHLCTQELLAILQKDKVSEQDRATLQQAQGRHKDGYRRALATAVAGARKKQKTDPKDGTIVAKLARYQQLSKNLGEKPDLYEDMVAELEKRSNGTTSKGAKRCRSPQPPVKESGKKAKVARLTAANTRALESAAEEYARADIARLLTIERPSEAERDLLRFYERSDPARYKKVLESIAGNPRSQK